MSPSSSAPTVSVIVPVYNTADLIETTLESVLKQTYQDFEVVVVDDGSTDGTGDIVKDYDESVRYIRKENGGTASARNRGIREARGDYVALLDADDRWRPTKLDRQMKEHAEAPDLIWSYTDSYLVDADSGEIILRKTQVKNRTGGDVLEGLLKGNFIAPSTVIIKRSVFEKVGTFDESALYHSAEDWELWMKIAARYPVRFVNEPLVETRQHTRRKTKTMDLDHALKERLTIINDAVERNPARLAAAHDEARANLYVNFGRKWLDREERGRARKLFVKALQYDPTCWEAMVYGAATILPRSILRSLGVMRNLLRTLGRHSQNAFSEEIKSEVEA